MKGMCSFSCSF